MRTVCAARSVWEASARRGWPLPGIEQDSVKWCAAAVAAMLKRAKPSGWCWRRLTGTYGLAARGRACQPAFRLGARSTAVPALNREGTVREPNARSGAPTASPPRPSCDAAPRHDWHEKLKCVGCAGRVATTGPRSWSGVNAWRWSMPRVASWRSPSCPPAFRIASR